MKKKIRFWLKEVLKEFLKGTTITIIISFVLIALILDSAYIWNLVESKTKEFPWLEVLVFTIILFIPMTWCYYLFSKITTRKWFLRTIHIMIFTLILGIVVISNIPIGNFYTNFGILISTVMFSIPLGMKSIYDLYDIEKSKSK